MNGILKQALDKHRAGELAEAERLYRSLLISTPEDADVLSLLGTVLVAKGDGTEAVALIKRAIKLDPKAALFRFHLGNAFMSLEQYLQAAAAFKQTIMLEPSMAEAHYNLGNAVRLVGDWNSAIEAYREAIKIRPAYAEAHSNLALALVRDKHFAEALKEAQSAVVGAPDYAEGWLTLCNVAEKFGDYSLSLTAGKRAVELAPDNPMTHFGYGVALCRLDRYTEAIPVYQRALAIKPDLVDVLDNLAQSYQSLNQLELAENTYRKAVEAAGQTIEGEDGREVDEEEYGNRHWHLALMELLRGKYIEGFARYRARFEDVGGLKRQKFSRPLWRGESLKGKTLLVTDEQGYGDTLMLSRYCPLLKADGVRVMFSVHPVLKPLFEGWPGADEIVTHGQPISGFDYYASVFDLPHRLGTTLATIPTNIPYLPILEPDPSKLLVKTDKLKVGVVWGGNPIHGNDVRRSIPLSLFADMFAEKNVQFFNLNRDLREGDSALLLKYAIIDLVPKLKNFADSARFMQQLDLIITCDTATAHLAGGMGKQVWTLLPFAPDWRWLTDRKDTPWYPTMRLFRQHKIGDWKPVIQDVREALIKKLSK